MRNQLFTDMVCAQMEHCTSTLLRKGKEYSTEDDRLVNFYQAATLQQITPEKALLGMLSKHIISIYDMVKSERPHDSDQWEEKIGDAINYLLILRALVFDTGKSGYSSMLPDEEENNTCGS